MPRKPLLREQKKQLIATKKLLKSVYSAVLMWLKSTSTTRKKLNYQRKKLAQVYLTALFLQPKAAPLLYLSVF
jgi:hypothetical protein